MKKLKLASLSKEEQRKLKGGDTNQCPISCVCRCGDSPGALESTSATNPASSPGGNNTKPADDPNAGTN